MAVGAGVGVGGAVGQSGAGVRRAGGDGDPLHRVRHADGLGDGGGGETINAGPVHPQVAQVGVVHGCHALDPEYPGQPVEGHI